jgi:hypothetical protein
MDLPKNLFSYGFVSAARLSSIVKTMKHNNGMCANPERTILAFAERERLKIRRDVDGSLVVIGRFGQLFEYSGGVMGLLIMPNPPRLRYWGSLLRKLKDLGFLIRQDADGEGTATFDANSQKQSSLAIRACGVKRIQRRSPAQLQAARRGLHAANNAKNWLKGAGGRGIDA